MCGERSTHFGSTGHNVIDHIVPVQSTTLWYSFGFKHGDSLVEYPNYISPRASSIEPSLHRSPIITQADQG